MRDLFASKAEDSILKHLDARTKLTLVLATAILTVACSGAVSQIILFVVSLVYVLLLKRYGLLIVLYALMVVMMALAAACGLALGEFFPGIGGISMKSLAIPFMRGLSMMNVVVVLAMTTRVEDLLLTLERMRLPFYIFLPTAVMLRFIPTFTQDVKQVWETLKIRGWPVGPAMLTVRPMLCARLTMAPVLFRALKSSETLGVAAELKGLGTSERTMRNDGKTLTSLDARVLSMLALTIVAVIIGEVYFADVLMDANTIGMP